LSSDESQTDEIPAGLLERAFPVDLIIAAVWLAANILVMYLHVLNEMPVSALLVLPGMFFFPGYCLIAALFPKDSDLELTERIALSLGISIAIVPLIGLGLNFTPFGIRLGPILISLTILSLVLILAAYYRRALLPIERRFRFPFSDLAGNARHTIFPEGAGTVDRLLVVVTMLAILAAVLVTVYVITVPKEGEQFTEFFILGHNQTAALYPDRISVGQNYPMYVGIGNHEYRNTNYTIETWLTSRQFDNTTNTSHLIAMDPSDRLTVTLAHNETFIIPYNLSVKKTTYNRVEFLLFRESIPGADIIGSDRINASYRNVNLWIMPG